jgi:hypothetical protein
MKKIEEVVLRIVQDDIEDYLKSVGFRETSWGTWTDVLDRKEIHLKADGIYCYSVDRGSVYGDPYLEMHLNFIPQTTILDYLLRGIHFVD